MAIGTGRSRSAVASAMLAGVALALAAPSAGARGLSFSNPLKLPNSPPKGELQGGEPSVAFDPAGRYVYVVAPGGGENGGVGFWRSSDGGRPFPHGKRLGSLPRGRASGGRGGPDHPGYGAVPG